MKRILPLFLLILIIGSCEKTKTVSDPETPDWLMDRISLDEEAIKSNPQSGLDIAAWIRYTWEDKFYFEYVNLLSSAGPKIYRYDGTELMYTDNIILDYNSKKCCRIYVWKGPSYIDIYDIDPEVFLNIGYYLYYKYSDIDLYDSSTHVLYFKANHSEFDKNSSSTFRFLNNGDTIYKGDFWPSFRSDHPTGPYISTQPFWLQDFALWIENRDENKPDLRNSQIIIQTFKDRNLLHSGLLVVIESIECTISQVTFTFSVTNKDQSLLIMDPDKMGVNLFHYYTNGLVFWKSDNSAPFYVKVAPEAPSSYDEWEIEWLTKISPDETKTFVFNYPLDTPLSPGEYKVNFTYPGLSFQVSREQLLQNNDRIWLGGVKASKVIVIN